MANYDIHASVDPAVRTVTVGDDATFSCLASGNDVGNVSIVYNWVAGHAVISEKRFIITDDSQSFRILGATSAENNTEVTCSIRSSESKRLISSGKSKLLVMPIENVPQPTTDPQLESSTEFSSTLKTTSSLYSDIPSESVHKTSQTGVDLRGLDTAIISGIVAGAVALIVFLIIATIILCRHSKKKRLGRQASFSGRSRRSFSGVPKVKRYEFFDPKSGDKMMFSEPEGFTHKKHNESNQELLQTISKGRAPDILANLQKSSAKNNTKNGYGCRNNSIGNDCYENVTPTYFVVPDKQRMTENERPTYERPTSTDILINNDSNENDMTMFEETNNMKNAKNDVTSDLSEFRKMDTERQNSSISSEDSLNKTTETICLSLSDDTHENSTDL